MFTNILVPFDGSKYAERALQYAANLAREYNSKMTIVHIAIKKVYPLAETAIIIDTEKEGQEILKKSEQEVESFGIKAEYTLVIGNPADEILKLATDKKIDLIVMGSRGLSDIKAFFLGSVSKKVSQRAECPVLIVK